MEDHNLFSGIDTSCEDHRHTSEFYEWEDDVGVEEQVFTGTKNLENLPKESQEALKRLEEMASAVIWFSRSRKWDDPSWEGAPEQIMTDALEAQQKYLKKYPGQIKDITANNLSESQDATWNHGFYSGLLAASRFVGEVYDGGLGPAVQHFPNLDT